MVPVLSVKCKSAIPFCRPCELAKSNRSLRPKVSDEFRRSNKPLEPVHADIGGPIRQASRKGGRYFVPKYDDACCLSLVRFMRLKGHAGSMLKDMMTELETVFGGKGELNVRSDL